MRDTIDMAREANIVPYIVGPTNAEYLERLKTFEALVRADEREAFAKIQFESILQAIRIEREACAALADKLEWADNKGIASAIRERGKT